MRTRRSLAAAAAVLGLLSGAVSAAGQFLPVLVDRADPSFGFLAVGMTTASFLLSTVLLFAVAYWHGTAVDVAAEYGSIALVVALVGGGASLVGFLVVGLLAAGPGEFVRATGILLSGVYTVALRVVDFAITGIAGAAIGHFRTG